MHIRIYGRATTDVGYDGEDEPVLDKGETKRDIWGTEPRGRCLRLSLRTLNTVAMWSHGLMSIAVLAVAVVNKAHEKCVPVSSTFNAGRPGPYANTSSSELLPGPGICFGYLALAFELVCFAAHVWIWWNFNVDYQAILTKKINPWRWLEYAVSSSFMVLCIVSIVGQHSLGALLGLAGCNAATMATGLWSEQANWHKDRNDRKDWFPFALGVFLQAVVWTAVFVAYGTTATKLTPPWFVHVFPVQLFAFFNCFAVVEGLWLNGSIERYEDKEWWYIFLSLSSKISLAALIIGATF